MREIRNHRDLEAWQIAMEAVLKTYDVTAEFPALERYGLSSQMRRAAVSVPSNIAEGQARSGRASLNHVAIALGSLAELDTQLEVAVRLAYVSLARTADLRNLIGSDRRLLYGLRRAKRANLALTASGPACVILLALRLFI
jgi:four helix bundle protein